MSIVMGAMRSPRSQARTRSRCHAILVPSRMRSVWSVSVSLIASVTSRLQPPDLVLVVHLFLIQMNGPLERVLEAALESHHHQRLLLGWQLGVELDGGADAPIEPRAHHVTRLQAPPGGQLVQRRLDARHALLRGERLPARRGLRIEAVVALDVTGTPPVLGEQVAHRPGE